MLFSRSPATALIALMVGAASLTGTDAFAANEAAVEIPEAEMAGISGMEYVDISVERIQVIGKKIDRKDVVGSATRLSAEDLEVFKYQDINRTLRLVPGVNIQEEDGYGLRPNIGLRGSGVERSAKITLMEDGVLIAPAPYAAPSAYYFPTAGRMEAVEVRKGSAAIKFGPRSVGGAINLVSRSIPEEFGGFVDGRLGSDGLRTVHAVVGGTGKNIAGVVEMFNSRSSGFKTLPGGGNTGFDVQDYLAKLRVFTDEDAAVQQALEIKVTRTSGDSNETYLGLADADFAADPYQRYAASALDRIDTTHQQIQITHEAEFENGIQLVTTAYRNEFERDWFKLNDIKNAVGDGCSKGNFVLQNPVTCATELSWLKGEADSAVGAINIRHNARSYVSRGVQSLIAVPFATGNAEHDLEISLRYSEDYEDRLQFDQRYSMVSGALELASTGTPGSSGNRIVSANAWAFFVQDSIKIGDWTFEPGVRFESINLNRSDWAKTDPTRSGPANIRETTKVNTFVPGLGISYKVNENMTLTGGIFKGFNPPGAGNANAVEEKSLNAEFGVIYDNKGAYLESMVFFSDYSNILGTCTASVGCNGEIGDQFNGGKARILGLELVAGYTAELGLDWEMPFYVNYTYTDAKFQSDFQDSFWGNVTDGDAFPYLSAHQLTVSGGISNDTFSTIVQANYVSASRVVAGSGNIPAGERVDARVVVDLSAHYQLSDAVALFASIDNLFDKAYSVARNPIGLRPGKPRTWTSGVKVTF